MPTKSSPYFDKKRRRSPCSTASDGCPGSNPKFCHLKSSYFARSPLSVHGCLDNLGPLIFALSKRNSTDYSCEKTTSCKCSRALRNEALSHFQECAHFRSRYERCETVKIETDFSTSTAAAVAAAEVPTPLTCWELEDLRIQHSVRHLCSNRCYMRAYAPVREFVLLRKAVHELTDAPLDELFSGWKCKLDPNLEQHDSIFLREFLNKQFKTNTPPKVSVLFVSPEGKSHSNRNELTKVLLKSRQNSGSHSSNKTQARKRLQMDDTLSDRSILCPAVTSSQNIASDWWFISQIETPLGLLEELFYSDPWQLLISAILLNRTSRVQVDAALFEFLCRWPNAEAAAHADAEEMSLVIQPLGLRNKRARGIIRFSNEYIDLLKSKEKNEIIHDGSMNVRREMGTNRSSDDDDRSSSSKNCLSAFQLSRKELLGLFYCGDYVAAAYQLFIRRDLRSDHPDRALTWYVEYQRERKSNYQ